jgi:hypothetical protein
MLVPSLRKETPALGRNARAQTRQERARPRGERAQTTPWTRQSTPSHGRLSPPLPLYFCITYPHPSSYTPDKLTSWRRTRRRRHDHRSAATVLPALERRQYSLVLPLLRQHAH